MTRGSPVRYNRRRGRAGFRAKPASLLALGSAVLAVGILGPTLDGALAAAAAAGGVLLLPRVPRVLARMKERRAFSAAGIEDVDKLDGFAFERYLAHLLRSHGYKVLVTPESGDFGADLVVTDVHGERAVVQAKRYTGTVGIKAVQEVVGAKAHYKATQAFCITNSDFTPAARTLAKSNDVALLSRKDLIKLIHKT
ncbi:restriction endonuclease [Acidithiobacillus sp.]|uniref:restriction endonuclease n=1 Tax=Acidithiobacillus sp. TaxID=1872118 RepID=UPI003D05A10E